MTTQLQYTSENLLVLQGNNKEDPNQILSSTSEKAGRELISFEVRRLRKGQNWTFKTADNELVTVNLSGQYSMLSNLREWIRFGDCENVFSGARSVLYLPCQTDFTINAEITGEFAVAWVPTDEKNAPRLISSDQVKISVCEGDNVSRQINDLLPPGSPVHRLVLVEVYTPSRNWSSYAPHKPGVHLEVDSVEIHFYKIDAPKRYAYQRIYTDENPPIHRAGHPIDALSHVIDHSAEFPRDITPW